ncbi:hypothetical protein E2320_016701 [Naja naja]|nr:hypothetical protein E2320_016701 [Naja naja]
MGKTAQIEIEGNRCPRSQSQNALISKTVPHACMLKIPFVAGVSYRADHVTVTLALMFQDVVITSLGFSFSTVMP